MKRIQNKVFYHRKLSRLTLGIITGLLVIAFSSALFILFSFLHAYFERTYSVRDLYRLWSNGDYRTVYKVSDQMLLNMHFNNAVRTMHGYSAFFMAVSDNDPQNAQMYLDRSINSLRIALTGAAPKVVPQLEYMLGKAYYFKDTFSSFHYYADLTVHYLQNSVDKGYAAADTPEYLGLSYAALGMTRESISTFTEALKKRDSDVLLLAIAEQYFKNNQYASAKPYLFHLNTQSQNEVLLLKSHQLLGKIYRNEKQFEEAMKEFQLILEKNPNSADAYYEIGVLYEVQDNDAAARAEWRRALRIQPNHVSALQKFTGGR